MPVVYNANYMKLWSLTSLPIPTNARWLQVKVEQAFIVKTAMTELWTSLNQIVFTNCVSNSFRMCNHNPPWKSTQLTSSATACLSIGEETNVLCKLAKTDLSDKIYYERLRPDEWLISANTSNLLDELKCTNMTTRETSTTSIPIPQY